MTYIKQPDNTSIPCANSFSLHRKHHIKTSLLWKELSRLLRVCLQWDGPRFLIRNHSAEWIGAHPTLPHSGLAWYLFEDDLLLLLVCFLAARRRRADDYSRATLKKLFDRAAPLGSPKTSQMSSLTGCGSCMTSEMLQQQSYKASANNNHMFECWIYVKAVSWSD